MLFTIGGVSYRLDLHKQLDNPIRSESQPFNQDHEQKDTPGPRNLSGTSPNSHERKFKETQQGLTEYGSILRRRGDIGIEDITQRYRQDF